ncbi:MAG: 16S rRNA (guanine(966)-N(2))-methyltransferase RsmD [Gammaproteobacteria bacterium HGW-Gammaproteobacteria-1]|jgi:16S rRNA (guanine966-N2)-methyltransferase|nr:MAG: 16S rRNA (guanine(966)-N(2))-methyltransferase RsmD [Gammaproteobacteria bacterium HGW-Gammaproteobacteria-1]
MPRHGPNQLRIIGGTWRSRRVAFPDVEGLRPSPDRVRETLFNWLAPIIEGARCLDLYAGSGALGLEALSRGAGAVVLVDSDRRVVTQLEQNLKLLGAVGAQVIQADAMSYLQRPPQPFDVVFLDPPFRKDLLPACLTALAAGWLAPGARVYVENEKELGEPPLPPGWELARSKQAGQVRYSLLLAPPA